MNLKQNNTTTKLMEKNKTAVEWLHEIAKQREPDKFDWEQAKAMELAQRIDDYNNGHTDRQKNIFRLPTKN